MVQSGHAVRVRRQESGVQEDQAGGDMTYRHDLEAARRELAARERRYLHGTRFGTVEYADQGDGMPVLVSHPLFGGFDVGLGIAHTYIGDGFRIVAPSRFGYLGSSLPVQATPADQADAYAAVLDALGIDRVAVFGYSAGGPSTIQFALRHPDRTAALVLLSSALPGEAGQPPKAVAQLVFGSDVFFWTLKRFLPAVFARLLGMPKGFQPSTSEQRVINEAAASMFPHRPRKHGVLYDLYVSNPDVQTYPLEAVAVPTLVITATDDGLSASQNSVSAADRMPHAQLLEFARGGHLHIAHEAVVREKIHDFISHAAAS